MGKFTFQHGWNFVSYVKKNTAARKSTIGGEREISFWLRSTRSEANQANRLRALQLVANCTKLLSSIWHPDGSFLKWFKSAESDVAVHLEELHFIDNPTPSRILISWSPLSELRPSVSSRHIVHRSWDTPTCPYRCSWAHSESPREKFHMLHGQAEAKRNGHTVETVDLQL